MARNAVEFSEFLKSLSTVDPGIERNRAGAKVIEGWEQLVKITASKATEQLNGGMRK